MLLVTPEIAIYLTKENINALDPKATIKERAFPIVI